MDYICKCCGYVYSFNLGCPDNDIEPLTPFEQIEEEDWLCPLCGSPKEDFEPWEG